MNAPSSPLPQRHRYTVAEYHRMAEAGVLGPEARVELIEGDLIDMAPAGSRHASAVNRLNQQLFLALSQRAVISVQNPLRLSTVSEPEPDIAVLAPREDFYRDAHPGPDDVWLIVEVAQSSLDFDRHTKIPLYARYQIPEVWLVDLENQRLERYRQPQLGHYQSIDEIGGQERVALVLAPEVMVGLDGLF